MALDTDELKKLSPEQRVKRLKEMEEQRKKEVGEIETLIKKSMNEAKNDRIAEKVAPPPRQVDITKLFTEEEKEWKHQERRQALEEQAGIKYLADTNYKASGNIQQQVAQDYSSLKKMLDGYVSPGGLSGSQIDQLDKMEQRLGIASYQTNAQSEKMAVMMSGSREALHRIKKYAGIE
jgi:hypothetical protein